LKTQGYYFVQWDTEAYLFDATNEESASDDLQIEDGTLVVRGKYHSLIKGAPFWYSPPKPDDESVLMRVQTVLSADVELHALEDGIREPPWNKRRMIERLSASKVLEVDHMDLLKEIGRRERIDQEETIVVDASDVEDGWSSDEQSDDEVEIDKNEG
jgi:hypothetical protein